MCKLNSKLARMTKMALYVLTRVLFNLAVCPLPPHQPPFSSFASLCLTTPGPLGMLFPLGVFFPLPPTPLDWRTPLKPFKEALLASTKACNLWLSPQRLQSSVAAPTLLSDPLYHTIALEDLGEQRTPIHSETSRQCLAQRFPSDRSGRDTCWIINKYVPSLACPVFLNFSWF